MVRTIGGKEIEPLDKRIKSKLRYLNLYINMKQGAVTNPTIKSGIDKLFSFFSLYTRNDVLWSYETVLEFLNTSMAGSWCNAIKAAYPSIGNALDESMANIAGMALLDFLIHDDNTWIVDNLEFEDVNEKIQSKRYFKQQGD